MAAPSGVAAVGWAISFAASSVTDPAQQRRAAPRGIILCETWPFPVCFILCKGLRSLLPRKEACAEVVLKVGAMQ